jgi:uncharacterized protein with beta-barrel porin domain
MKASMKTAAKDIVRLSRNTLMMKKMNTIAHALVIVAIVLICVVAAAHGAEIGLVNNTADTITVRGDDELKNDDFHNSGKIIIENTGKLTVIQGGSLKNDPSGYLNNLGALANDGRFYNNGLIDNRGSWTFSNRLVNQNAGAILNNYGSIVAVPNIKGKLGDSQFQVGKGTIVNNYKEGLMTTYYLQNRGTINNYGRWESKYCTEKECYLINKGDGIINNTGTLETEYVINRGNINNATGGTIINKGDLKSYYDSGLVGKDGAIDNAGTFKNTAGATLTVYNSGVFNNEENGLLDNAVGATVTVDGTSALNNKAGAVFVNNGTFNTSTTFTNNGLFMGTGTTVGNVVNNGTIAPGNSIGTMTITGNFTSTPGSVYQVEINPKGESDRLNVSGTATLNGGLVSVLAGSDVYGIGFNKDYLILHALGGVNGTYGGVVSDLAFLTPTLRHELNDVWLTMARNSTKFCDVANNSNQASVGCVLDQTHTSPDMINVLNTLLGLNAAQARNAYDQMSGYIHIAMVEATNYSFSRYINNLSGRMEGFGAGGASFANAGNILLASRDDVGSDAGSLLVAAVNSMNKEGIGGDVKKASPWGLWAKGYGNLGDREGNDLSSKYDYRGGGIVIGFDRKIGERFLIGVSTGYSHTRVDMKELSENGTLSSYQGSVYGAYNAGALYVHGLVAYGYNRYDTARNISFGYGSGNISRTANATYAGNSLSGYVETGYRLPIDSVSLIPMASLQAGSLWRSSFTEADAGALNLGVENEYATSLIGSLGFKLQKEFKMQNSTITPALRVRWLHEFANNQYSMNAVFASDPVSTFNITGEGAKRDSGVVGFGLAWEIGRNLGLAMTYDVNISGDHTDHSGMIGLRYRW